jgi:drug/metabolite transporter (DMT)-like permease
MGRTEWLLLIALSVLWGGSFFFISIIVKDLPPFTIVMLRVMLAAVVLNLVCRVRGLSLPLMPAARAAFFGMGVLNNVLPFALIAWGQTQIAGGLAAILNATTPLFGVIVAHLLTRDEKMTASKLSGVIIGFCGVAVMIGPAALGGAGAHVLAQLAVLCASLSYAVSSVFGRRFKAMGLSPLQTATGQLTASALILIPLAGVVDRPWTLAMPPAGTWMAIAGLVLFSTALAYIIYFRILASSGAVNIMLVTLLVPVSAILLSWMFRGEHLDPRHYVGMALIACGLSAIDGRLLRLARSRLKASNSPSGRRQG